MRGKITTKNCCEETEKKTNFLSAPWCPGVLFWPPKLTRNGILLPKLFWPTVRKNYSIDWEKLLKLEAEGLEFANFLRSLEQSIHAETSEQFLVTECFFKLFLDVSYI